MSFKAISIDKYDAVRALRPVFAFREEESEKLGAYAMQLLKFVGLCLVAACAIGLLGDRAGAVTLTVDGNLADWGFHVADNNHSTFVPAPGLDLLGIDVHDHNDNGGINAPLDVYSGGQKFDAECLAAAVQGGNLFIAISTGQRPDNGFTNYAPGDIKIDTSGGVYGVEVGGGIGGGAGSAITTGAPGASYTMNEGFTTAFHSTPAAQTAGSVWFNPYFTFFQQMQIPGATFVGNSNFIYTRNTETTQHAVIELSIPLSFFGTNTIQNISWAPSCDNSFLSINTTQVPEPSSVALALLGAFGACWTTRRRRAVKTASV
jgi:hypothetical protein